MAAVKFITYNRKTFTYTIGNKVVDYTKWWYMAKWLIVNKRGCMVQDDEHLLMYQT